MKDNLVVAKDLRKTYLAGTPLEVQVLKGISFSVNKGEFVAVIGQSGSGKSTLLNILGALDKPSGGQILIDGIDLSRQSSDELANFRNVKLGFVFQFHHLMNELSCLENALTPILIARGRATAAERVRIIALMQRVGLKDVIAKRANQISGGQQQRVAIVRALANNPALVLADEPTGNLDSNSTKEVFAMMREITLEQGVTFMMVTHDERLANQADRIFHIVDGKMDIITEIKA